MNKIKQFFIENKDREFTLNDIFIKHNEFYLLLCVFCYLLTPICHAINYAVVFEEHPLAYRQVYPSWIALAQVMGLLFAVVGIISYFVKYKHLGIKQHISENPTMPIFILVSVIIVVTTIIGTYSEYGTYYWSNMSYYLCGLMVFYFSASLIRKENNKKIVLHGFLALSVFLGMLIVVDEFIVRVPICIFVDISSTFYHGNHYGYFLTIAILLSATLFLLTKDKKQKAILFLVFVLNSLMLALANALGAFLGVLVAMVFMIVTVSIKNRKFSVPSVVLVAVFILICFLTGLKYQSFFSDLVTLKNDTVNIVTDSPAQVTAGSGRWMLWQRTFELIKEKPILGWGCDGVNLELLKVEKGITRPHNEYLEYAVHFGIPCALLYIAGLLIIYLRAWKNRKIMDNSSIACLVASLAYIGSAFFGNVCFYTYGFFFIVLGIASRQESKD